ncbi:MULTISPECIES: helix-turn-helix domain-containing protein [Clostridioides]|uniref:helix-turn-helix domain-containing protein n=1 Tax=unclassified Clostridioides TaxID=2635829 RepID=UPI00038D193B|nr:helix-turn-helix family protein [Clostridioides difficile CD160]MCC0646168.1 helix-turn-helix domain-containing protein [Clostridioides sp. ZZV14-6150]MCC0718323.1 helix-turn-helix domain-containing protein [Clostridioides sp. ZZV14-6105]MCC0723986.1 helix-turn-helix domain-containing protein [Clostridioides sp. ZZV14-6104]MCC0724810.1 helix-turn-helix domain-containing protein [Clostridioides sp. ZZV14-6045]MCC0732256.1 helix-turn-helix domain-containing protein [Clostridioides sp. ZZV14-6
MNDKDVEIVNDSYKRLRELSEDESNAVYLLISGLTVTEVAKAIGVTRQTIYNWMNREHIRKEIDRRKQELTNQGNLLILKDLETYINNIKELASDKSDKRVMLAANQYLINRIYGTPTNTIIQAEDDSGGMGMDTTEIEAAIAKIRIRTKK